MCELLIYLTSKTHPDKDKDLAGSFKEGMVITAQEDGWKWSETEKRWPYKIVKIPSVAPLDVVKFLEPATKLMSAVEGVSEEMLCPYRLRRWVLDTEQLTSSLCSVLENGLVSAAIRLSALDAIATDASIGDVI